MLLTASILLVAASVLAGWAIGSKLLTSITGRMTAMNPFTALAFLAAGLWLALRSRNRPSLRTRVLVVLALIVFAVGLLKLMVYAGIGWLNFDRALFPGKLDTLAVNNYIASSTALLFVFSGILMLNAASKSKRWIMLNDVLLAAGFLVAYLVIVGYIYNIEPYYKVGPYNPMALNTAVTFLLLFIAFFLILPAGRLSGVFFSRHIGGKLATRAVPLVLLMPPAYGYARLLVQRAHIYSLEASIALDTGLVVLIVLLLLFYYAGALNKYDFERLVAEKEIARKEEKFRSLVFALKEGVIYYDRTGKIIFYNPSMAEIAGYAPRELIGRNVIEVFASRENLEQAKIRFSERLLGIGEDYEGTILHKNGTKLKVFITARPIVTDDAGSPATFISTVTDITERKKREEDLEAFSASAAHDLNAPIGQIRSLAELLLHSAKDRLSKDELELIEMLMNTTSGMQQLLKDLLLFYRSGINAVTKSPVDMNILVEEVLSAAHPHSAKIVVDNLPIARGDAVLLKQVWANLILNAIKYSAKKGQPEVYIGFIEESERNIYFVKDNGAGFDMAQSPKLFTPFKRLHSDFEGNGLGLPIVKRILESHGGSVWAESKAGEGATFYFTI